MLGEKDDYHITIIGAGIIGLTTACTLLKEYGDDKRLKLTIISEQFSPNTTADVSAGYWEPYGLEKIDERTLHWSTYTYRIFFDEFFSNKAPHAGIVKLTAYLLRWYQDGENTRALPPFRNIVQDFRVLDPNSMKMFERIKVPTGFSMLSIVVEPSKYLPQLMRFLSSDGRVTFVLGKVNTFEELKGTTDIIINCTGLASRFLAMDLKVRPARGQVIRIEAPWIKCVYNFETDDGHGYIIPQSDCVVLGGTFQLDDWNTSVNPEDTERIRRVCSTLVPGILEIPIGKVQVGLRPHRDDGVRLEYEKTMHGQHIIHCYGHSGSGVTLSWGCAKDVVDILKTLIPPKYQSKSNLAEHEQLWRVLPSSI